MHVRHQSEILRSPSSLAERGGESISGCLTRDGPGTPVQLGSKVFLRHFPVRRQIGQDGAGKAAVPGKPQGRKRNTSVSVPRLTSVLGIGTWAELAMLPVEVNSRESPSCLLQLNM